MNGDVQSLPCHGDDGCCRMAAAVVEDGHIIIRQRHHGRRHETRIPLSLIEDLRRIERAAAR